ncbi:MAG: hypothetical protein K940chlam2_00227 [Chlamydiae bacterium]|nr:hypothetical protein [Chlamydiota bacterium]
MKLHILFALFFTINACAFASDTAENRLVDQIISEQPESIESIEAGKLYLSPENIFATSEGLALENGCSRISLSHLSSDQDGCFLSFAKSDSMVVTCWNCKYVFDLNELVTACPNCGYGD